MLLKNNTNEEFVLLANCQAINCWYLYLYILLIFIMAGGQTRVRRPLHKLLLRWKIHTHKVFPKVWLSHPWNQCWTSAGHRSVGLCIAFPTVLLGKSILIKVSLCWQEYRPTGREIFVCIYVHTQNRRFIHEKACYRIPICTSSLGRGVVLHSTLNS